MIVVNTTSNGTYLDTERRRSYISLFLGPDMVDVMFLDSKAR